MTTVLPHRTYRHEAFLYDDPDTFLDGTVPFVLDGVEAGQPVMVAVRACRSEPLRDALGKAAAEVHFVDMTELGHNPARIIPGWRRFIDEHCQDDQPVRGIGEPIWRDRRTHEIVEAQLHEALLNVAVDPDTPMWLRCPYDVGVLTEHELAEAARSHPILVEAGTYAGSLSYGGLQHVDDLFAADLPEPTGPTDGITLPAEADVIGALVTAHAVGAGVLPEPTWALSLAVRETAAAAAPGGILRMWSEEGALVCEIRDPGRIDDPMTGRRQPQASEPDPRGLWLANQVCDLVQVRATPHGTTVRIITWR